MRALDMTQTFIRTLGVIPIGPGDGSLFSQDDNLKNVDPHTALSELFIPPLDYPCVTELLEIDFRKGILSLS